MRSCFKRESVLLDAAGCVPPWPATGTFSSAVQGAPPGCADPVMKTRLALAQINVTVGDFAGNVARIVAAARAAHNDGAQLMVAPELALSGYPPEDLLL